MVQDWNGSGTGFIQRPVPCPALNTGKVRRGNTGKPECSKTMSSVLSGGRVMWVLFCLTGNGAGNNCLFSPFWPHFSNGAMNSRYSWDSHFYPMFLQFFSLPEKRLCGFLHCLPRGGKKLTFFVCLNWQALSRWIHVAPATKSCVMKSKPVLILSVPFQKNKYKLVIFLMWFLEFLQRKHRSSCSNLFPCYLPYSRIIL